MDLIRGMNMKKTLIATGVSLALLSGFVAADEAKTYVEVGYSVLGDSDSINGQAFDVDLGAGTLGLGYQINDNFAVEGFVGTGLKDDSITVSGINLDAELKSIYGIYVKPSANLTDDVKIFAKVGYVSYELEASVPALAFSESEDFDDFSYGVGAQFDISDNTYISASYTAIDEVDGFGMALGFKF